MYNYFFDVNGGELFSVTNEEIFKSESSNNKGNSSQSDFDFEGAPIFSNENVTVYPQQDKNGNWYPRVTIDEVLMAKIVRAFMSGEDNYSFNVFVNNGPHEGLENYFNQLVEDFNGK